MKKNIFKYIWVLSLFLTWIIACKDRNKLPALEQSQFRELWTCSMHPQIIRDKPGTCPICGMALVKKEGDAQKLADIKLENLLQSTDRFIISSIPVTTIIKSKEQIEVQALGAITYDTRLINTISARVSGRIEKLYVHYRYEHVHAGTKIMDIYSPEFLTAEETLLFLLKNDPTNSSLIEATKQRLLLLGMSKSQLGQIIKTQKPSLVTSVYSNYSGHLHEAGTMEVNRRNPDAKMDVSGLREELPVKEGMYIQKGQTIFKLFSTDKSWVLLNIFPGSVGLVKVGDPVKIIPETAPASSFIAKIDFIEPLYRKENKTLMARVYFDNSKRQIPIGSQVTATIFVDTMDADWLPQDAILSLGRGKIVFLKTSGGFQVHKVETGITNKNQIQILSGLISTDSVAANAQFLTDSESFIKVNKQP